VLPAILAAVLGTAHSAEIYRIGPGDQLRVEVGTRTDISGQYLVAENGTITIPVVGLVRAQGKTATELGEDLSRRLSIVDRSIPNVTVTVLESASNKIFVLGAVVLPGAYNFKQAPTTWDAINQAGGSTTDADLSAVEVIPGEAGTGRATARIDVAAAIREGRLESLTRLRAGDTVRVPRLGGATTGAGSMVYIFGAIGAQGSIPIEQAPDLMTALLRAGGPGAAADLERIEIIRKDGQRLLHLRVNVNEYISKSNPAGNVPLMAGDTVYLPVRRSRISSIFGTLGIISPLLALATSILALTR
jgi:polysaccharide export outer membrane protein